VREFHGLQCSKNSDRETPLELGCVSISLLSFFANFASPLRSLRLSLIRKNNRKGRKACAKDTKKGLNSVGKLTTPRIFSKDCVS
jgi:hypothetical protein